MDATASFHARADGKLDYHEGGQLTLPTGYTQEAYKDYVYEITPSGLIVYYAETPLRLFQTVNLFELNGTFVGQGSHFCDPDQYSSHYEFHPDGSFQIIHDVKGSRKAYIMQTLYRRKA